MKKKNVAQSAHSDDVRDHVPDKESRNDQLERLARTFFGSSSSQHIRTVDGKVESNSIKHNNPGTDFRNQFEQFEANEDMSEKNIKNKDFHYAAMMKSQGMYNVVLYQCDSIKN